MPIHQRTVTRKLYGDQKSLREDLAGRLVALGAWSTPATWTLPVIRLVTPRLRPRRMKNVAEGDDEARQPRAHHEDSR